MKNSQLFDYDQPTRESLMGIYVEVSDDTLEQVGSVEPGSAAQPALQPAMLFGLTLTADDGANIAQPMPVIRVADTSPPVTAK